MVFLVIGALMASVDMYYGAIPYSSTKKIKFDILN